MNTKDTLFSDYERQITSNSSSSSIAFDYAAPRAATFHGDVVFDISDTEAQPGKSMHATLSRRSLEGDISLFQYVSNVDRTFICRMRDQ